MFRICFVIFTLSAHALNEIKPTITRWESICEKHLLSLGYSEEIDIFYAEGGLRAIEREYTFECSRVVWQKTFNLHQIRRIQAYGARLRLLDPTNEKLSAYEFLEELWPTHAGDRK